MNNERLRLGITQEAIDQTERHLAATTDTEDLDNIASYARGVGKRIHQEQPYLYEYLRAAVDHFKIDYYLTFAYAAALTYDMIPQEARERILTEDHIQATHQTLLEHRENPDNPSSPHEINWFLEKLERDSPDYLAWLGQTLTDLNDIEDKKDFILGSTMVAMAFYTRADAEILAETLY